MPFRWRAIVYVVPRRSFACASGVAWCAPPPPRFGIPAAPRGVLPPVRGCPLRASSLAAVWASAAVAPLPPVLPLCVSAITYSLLVIIIVLLCRQVYSKS